MPLICVECGNIFDECEASVDFEYHSEVPGGAYERFMKCPCCGSDEIEESARCKKCGGEFLPGELFGSYYCEECLKESVTFEVFLDFATTGVKCSSDVDTLEDFMLREIFEVNGRNEVLTCSSFTFKNFMRNTYNEFVKADQLQQRFSGKGDLLDKINDYMTDCELWGDFAEWLHEKEVRK